MGKKKKAFTKAARNLLVRSKSLFKRVCPDITQENLQRALIAVAKETGDYSPAIWDEWIVYICEHEVPIIPILREEDL